MARKKRKGKRKKRDDKREIYCFFCDREFTDEGVLVEHQKAKHFKCEFCGKRLTCAGGMSIHVWQMHKEKITKVPNALKGRDDLEKYQAIHGMDHVPEFDADGNEQAPKKPRTDAPIAAGPPQGMSTPAMQMPMMAPFGMPPMGLPPGMPPGMPPMMIPPPSMIPGFPGGLPAPGATNPTSTNDTTNAQQQPQQQQPQQQQQQQQPTSQFQQPPPQQQQYPPGFAPHAQANSNNNNNNTATQVQPGHIPPIQPGHSVPPPSHVQPGHVPHIIPGQPRPIVAPVLPGDISQIKPAPLPAHAPPLSHASFKAPSLEPPSQQQQQQQQQSQPAQSVSAPVVKNTGRPQRLVFEPTGTDAEVSLEERRASLGRYTSASA